MKTFTELNKFTLLFAGLLLSASLVGCGNNSKDPMKDYAELKNDGAPEVRVMDEVAHDYCSANIEGESALVVAEGQSIRSVYSVEGVNKNYAVPQLINAPEGVSFPTTKSSNNKYQLSYNAKKGTLSINENFKEMKFEIAPLVKSQNNRICTKKISIVITRSDDFPVITRIQAPKTVEFDHKTPLTIVVDAKVKNLEHVQNLALHVHYDFTATSPEKPSFDISTFMTRQSVKYLNNNTHQFTYTIDSAELTQLLAKLAKENPLIDSFELQAQFFAINLETGNLSLAKNVLLTAKRPTTATVEAKK